MTRRYIGGQLVDVAIDGTITPIQLTEQPRKLPLFILNQALEVVPAIEEFLAQLMLPQVSIPGITLSPSPDIPSLPADIGMPIAEQPAQQPTQQEPLPPSEQLPATSPISPIFTRFGNPPDDLASAIQEFWPQSQWKNAAEVSYLESGWRRNAINDTVSIYGPCGTKYYIARLGIWANTELSIGYFQINICAHGATIAYWEDGRNNARKGAELYNARGGKYTDWLISAGTLGLPT